MQKLLVSLAFVLTMALGAVIGPAQVAVAAPAGQANCVAETISSAINTFGGRFLGTVIVVSHAHDEGAGEFIAPRASTNTCP